MAARAIALGVESRLVSSFILQLLERDFYTLI